MAAGSTIHKWRQSGGGPTSSLPSLAFCFANFAFGFRSLYYKMVALVSKRTPLANPTPLFIRRLSFYPRTVVMRLSNFSAVAPPLLGPPFSPLSAPLVSPARLDLALRSEGVSFRVCCNIIIIIDLLISSSGLLGSAPISTPSPPVALLLLQGPVAILMTPPYGNLYMCSSGWRSVSVLRLAVR